MEGGSRCPLCGAAGSSSNNSSSARLQDMEARLRVLLSTRQYDHPLMKLNETALEMAEVCRGARVKIHQHPRWRKSPEDLKLLASRWFNKLH